jgi:Tfp pilus tip-associated adhesin PilY1
MAKTKVEPEKPAPVNRATNPTGARRPIKVAPARRTAAARPTMSVVWGVSWFLARRKWELWVSLK